MDADMASFQRAQNNLVDEMGKRVMSNMATVEAGKYEQRLIKVFEAEPSQAVTLDFLDLMSNMDLLIRDQLLSEVEVDED